MSRQTLNMEAAQRGVQYLESVSKQPPQNWPRATPEQQQDLKALLEAVCQSDDLSEGQSKTLFEAADPIETGINAGKLLARSHGKNAIAAIARFFDWLDQHDELNNLFILCERGPDIIECFPADAAIELFVYTLEAPLGETPKSVITTGIDLLGNKHPEIQGLLAPLIIMALEEAESHSPEINSQWMMLAVEWQITEAAEAIERAFSNDRIDCGVMGGWNEVRRELHVEGMGLPMPEKPYNCLDGLDHNLGVGAFSKEPLHRFGEPNEEAVEKYLDTACTAFARSPEGRALLPEGHFAFNVQQFLELGMSCVGVHTENMIPADAEEILLRVFPRKVSMDATECDNTIDELVAFWRFCDRVHGIEHAAEIAERIEAIRKQFQEAMDDPANYGMAKSLFMMGKQAGFDMTTQEGCNAFVNAFNASRGSGGLSQAAPSPSSNSSTVRSRKQSLKERKKVLEKKKKGKKRR